MKSNAATEILFLIASHSAEPARTSWLPGNIQIAAEETAREWRFLPGSSICERYQILSDPDRSNATFAYKH